MTSMPGQGEGWIERASLMSTGLKIIAAAAVAVAVDCGGGSSTRSVLPPTCFSSNEGNTQASERMPQNPSLSSPRPFSSLSKTIPLSSSHPGPSPSPSPLSTFAAPAPASPPAPAPPAAAPVVAAVVKSSLSRSVVGRLARKVLAIHMECGTSFKYRLRGAGSRR